MKKLSFILLSLLIVLSLSCKKIETPEPPKFVLSDIQYVFTSEYGNVSKADISANFSYPGTLDDIQLGIFSYSSASTPRYYQTTINGNTITVTINNLTNSETYLFKIRYNDGIGYGYSDVYSFVVE